MGLREAKVERRFRRECDERHLGREEQATGDGTIEDGLTVARRDQRVEERSLGRYRWAHRIGCRRGARRGWPPTRADAGAIHLLRVGPPVWHCAERPNDQRCDDDASHDTTENTEHEGIRKAVWRERVGIEPTQPDGVGSHQF